MIFEQRAESNLMGTRYTLTISDSEKMQVELIPGDQALFDECARSEKVSDKLLALETLARRIEEQAERNQKQKGGEEI